MTTTRHQRWARAGLGVLGLLVLLTALLAWLNLRGEDRVSPGSAAGADAATIARGAYLARAGNCIGCHTARGGAEFAGGRGIETPFGTVYAPNLTPDRDTGLGSWSPSEFWRAMHNGRSKNGRLLYPAFPYPSFTLVKREDSDAIYAYLHSLKPVRQPNRAHELRFPYNLQASLAVWRALYFSPARFEPENGRSAEWNRGSYLVRGLGHCTACHAGRNVLGATSSDIELGGGLIPMQDWYAPSLASPLEAGVAGWSTDEVVALLKNGVSPRGSVMGPMAEVVFRSTQHLSGADLRAIAVFLQALPQAEVEVRPLEDDEKANRDVMQRGERLYADRCAACHGEQGQGVAGIYPPLAGNRVVTLPSPNNVIKAILHGGFAPTTAGSPRPFGMPPFAQSMTDDDIAALATYLRQSWGHAAHVVMPLEVHQVR